MLRMNLLDADQAVERKKAAKRVRDREAGARYRARHPERLRVKARASQAWNTKYAFEWALKNEYGITRARYDEMLIAQSGRCFTCQDISKRLHIDHCHRTGIVRGLLCGPCNQTLGLVKERGEVLLALSSYLQSA